MSTALYIKEVAKPGSLFILPSNSHTSLGYSSSVCSLHGCQRETTLESKLFVTNTPYAAVHGAPCWTLLSLASRACLCWFCLLIGF